MIGIMSAGIARIPHLESFLGEPVTRLHWWSRARGVRAIAGWGERPTAAAAKRLAARKGLPYVALEDGFLRSLGLGTDGVPPLSLVIDTEGIYYDASRPSSLERILATYLPHHEEEITAAAAMGMIRHHRLSKYNTGGTLLLPVPKARLRILVVDQTAGDASVRLGGASEQTFGEMLLAALSESRDAEVVVKTHPDVASRHKRGYLTDVPEHPRIRMIRGDVCPHSLLGQVDKVFVATSQMGFEALMAGLPVVTFGVPWYAGWGATEDRHPQIAQVRERRGARRRVLDLFIASYMRYARYIDPVTGLPGNIMDVIRHIASEKP